MSSHSLKDRQNNAKTDHHAAKTRRMASLATPTTLSPGATADISAALNLLLADLFALYVKTKNFHWHEPLPVVAALPARTGFKHQHRKSRLSCLVRDHRSTDAGAHHHYIS